MARILRIETARTGEYGSIPFLWTSGPRSGEGNVITSLAKVVAPILQLKRGTRQIAPLGASRIQETFVVFAKAGNVPAQKEVTRLTHWFKFAAELEENGDTSDTVYFVEQMKDEIAPKRFVVYSGSIAPVDHEVVTRDMGSDYSMFIITVERSIEGEYGDYKLTKTGGESVANHGGTLILPLHFQSSGISSRMSTFVVRAKGQGYLKKMWLGMKPNRDGFTSFDPEISIGNNSNKNSVFVMSKDTYFAYDTEYLEDGKILVAYDNPDWALRFRAPMNMWNLSVQQGNEAVRSNYIGSYHLIGRYRTNSQSNAKYGVRVGTGWEHPSTISWSNRLYIDPSIASDGDSEHRYIDYGIINIGTGMWSPEVRDRLVLESFNIYVESALVRGDGGMFGFDNMFLVPTNHFLYFNLDNEIGGDKRVELYTNQKGVTSGYVVNASGSDALGKPLSSPLSVYATIPDLVFNNWSIPKEASSVLVAVGDRGDNSTKALGSTNRVDIAAKLRTEAFAVASVGAT